MNIINIQKKVMSKSFSLCLRFYYWSHYKDLDELKKTGGYALFIGQKYNTFKEEIVEYEYINIKQYMELIVLGVNMILLMEHY